MQKANGLKREELNMVTAKTPAGKSQYFTPKPSFPKVEVLVTGDNPELNKKVINALHHLIGSHGITTSLPEHLHDDRPVAGCIRELEELNVQVAFKTQS